MWTKNHYRETEFLFNHRFLTTLKLERRIPETTQGKNPFNAIQLLNKQNVPSLIYDYLETKPWNKKVKTIQPSLLKYDNLIKFCYKLRSRKNYFCQNNFIKTTSTYKNHLCEFWKNTLG